MRAYEGGSISNRIWFSFVHRKGGVVFWVLYRSLSRRFFISEPRVLSVNSSISTRICPTSVFCLVIN